MSNINKNINPLENNLECAAMSPDDNEDWFDICNEDFDQLTNNMLLVVADELDIQEVEQRRTKHANNLPPSQCFQTFEQLPDHYLKEHLNEMPVNDLNDNKKVYSPVNFPESDEETLFASADFEMLSVPTPTNRPPIVKQILKDFCSSPLSPRSKRHEAYISSIPFYRSPNFHFKHQNCRTYKKKCTNLLNCFKEERREEETIRPVIERIDNDDCLSISSGLSVQEDLTQVDDEKEVEVCAVNETEKIYENLLNLSAYFTQKEERAAVVIKEDYKTNLADSSEHNNCIDIKDIQRENEQIHYNESSQNSLEELRLRITQHSLDVRNIINSISSNEKLLIKELLELRKEMPINWEELKNNLGLEEGDFLGFPLAEIADNLLDYELQYNSLSECTINEQKCTDDIPLFSEDECDDFFVNFKSQDLVSAVAIKKDEFEYNPVANTINTGNSVEKALNVLNELTNVPLNENNTATNISLQTVPMETKPIQVPETGNSNTEFPTHANVEGPVKHFGFATASCKKIHISNKAKAKTANIFNDIPDVIDLEDFKEIAKRTPCAKTTKNTNQKKKFVLEKSNSTSSVQASIEFSDIQFGEWKCEVDFNENETPEPLPMLTVDEDMTSNMSANSSLNASTSKFITRINLLSLSKRRKQEETISNSSVEIPGVNNIQLDKKTKSEIMEINAIDESTPNKHVNVVLQKSFSTPDNKFEEQFLPQTQTSSTPYASNMDVSANITLQNSLNTTLKSNRKSNSKAPTAKQRIERLQMYGEPPAVSPIVAISINTANNCRPSGLRRRSRKST